MIRSISGWSASIVRRGVVILSLQIVAAIALIAFVDNAQLPPALYWALLLLSSLLFTGWLLYTVRRFLDDVGESIRTLNDVTSTLSSGRESNKVGLIASEFAELQRLVGSIGTVRDRATRDIAEMKRLEQVRSEFLGNVSHELRTPIFTVQGFLETLIDGAVDDTEVRDEFLQKAHDNLLRLHALLNDLIEISRIESGEMKLSFRFFDLLDLMRGTMTNMEAKGELYDVTLHLAWNALDEEGRLMVYGDRKRIEQVLVNLLDNAIKYNRPGGDVFVDLTMHASTVEISIRDTGHGIAEEHLPRIFERFYRVDKARSRDVGGSGLGLAIVKHIVEAHGSTISVDSKMEHGSRFRFALQRHD